jgi:hypothetical protein
MTDQDHAECPDVGTLVDRLAQDLLGRHIGKSPGGGDGLGGAGAGDDTGQAKVHNLGDAGLGDDDVGGFYVAMDDMGGVCGGKAASNLSGKVEPFR